MIKKLIVVLAIQCLATAAFPQAFSGKTNAVRVKTDAALPATTLPTIRWITPTLERSNSVEESITFELEIQSDIPLRSVRLEVSAGGDTHTKKFEIAENETSKSIKQPLRLLPGDNEIKIIVENLKGGYVSSVRSILTGRDAITDAVSINRKDYALLIATDNYDNFGDLINPINDARTIESILKDKYGFQTELLLDPTQQEINDKLYEYNARKFDPQDQLLIFVAGHGVFDETLGQGYIVASNSQFNDKGKSSYIPHVSLRETIDRIKCEHIFLVMDACFGGTFDPVLSGMRADEAMDERADQRYLVTKLTKHTRKFLTSGSKEYVPDGTPGKHSPFAEKFILALRETGGGQGRLLTIDELRPYFKSLPTEARLGPFGKDDPQSDFVFVSKN